MSISGTRDAAVAGLCAAIESPLGPWLLTCGCATSPRGDRLDELGFEIPLVGGDVPTAQLHVADVADVLEVHLARR